MRVGERLFKQHFIFHIDALVESMKSGPFSLLIDGSNDTNLDKLNPPQLGYMTTPSDRLLHNC